MGTFLVSLPRLGLQLGIISDGMYPKILPEVRGGAQRAEGSVVEGKLPILLPLFINNILLMKQINPPEITLYIF